jgi:branched-chain amino acid transport system ATP-binding protein
MLLQSDNIVKRFGGLVAVNRASMNVEKGEIFGLIGPNGAGKTTFLNVIGGSYKPNEGTVRFNGEDITGFSPEKICWKGISRTFQVPRRFAKMTVLENVIVASTFGNKRSDKSPLELAEEALDLANCTLDRQLLAGKLSTSELKRLDLARALASQPLMLLLDEPASGLTPAEVDAFMELIRKIREHGITIIVVEHLMKMIMNSTDRMLVLDHGETIAEGTPDEIVKNPRVIEAYLGNEYLHEKVSKFTPTEQEAGHVGS